MAQNDMVDLMDKASEKIKKRQKQLENLPNWAFVNSRDIVHAKPDKLGREILKTVKLMYVKNGKDLTLYRYNLDNGLWEIMTKEEIEKIVSDKIDGINAWNAKDVSDTRKYIMNKAIIKQASETIDNVDPFKVHFKNGVYNFITNKLEPNKPDNYIFHGRNYNLDTSNTPTPLTDNWLSESVGDAKQYIMEFIGYIFYRSYEKIQNFTILLAGGGNGKSTFFNWLSDAVGIDNISNVSLQDLTDNQRRFTTSRLYQKNMNYYADISKGLINDPALLKSITGDDALDVENKGKDQRTIKPFAKLFFGANELPPFKDTSKGFGRRPMIVPFEAIEDFNERFKMQEIKKEIPAFIYKCLLAFRKALKRGYLSETPEMIKLRNEWLGSNDIVGLFIDDYCELNENYNIKKVYLYDSYKQYCLENGYRAMSNQKFKQELKRFNVFDKYAKKDGKSLRVFTGIRLKPIEKE